MNRAAVLFLGSALLAAGAAPLRGEEPGPLAVYRGLQPVVRFDISPRLDSLPLRPATDPGPELASPDRDDALAGKEGAQDVDLVVQNAVAPQAMPLPLVNFDGLIGNGPIPPSPAGDIGPGHYVVMSNVRFAIYSRAGVLLFGPVDNNTLWSGFGGACEAQNSGFPVALYDQFADRWLLSQFTSVGPEFFNCVALSQTGDPTGTYFRWAFSTGTNFPDFPRYGIWPDAVYIGTREFAGGSAGPFAGVGAYAVNRTQMLAGSPSPQMLSFLVPPGAMPYNIGDGLLPADLDGDRPPPPDSPHYWVGSMDQGGPYGAPQDALTVWKFDADFATPGNSTFQLAQTLPIAGMDTMFPCLSQRDCIPQPGAAANQLLDILSYRQRPTWRLAYRNFGTHESLVTNQSVEAATGLAGIRWWEVRLASGLASLFQEGTYAPGINDGIHRWMGSIAMDRNGNMALGFSASDASVTFPSSRYTGRLAADPPGQMAQGEGSFVAGTGIQQSTASRWGDFTTMSLDVDDCTFWYVNEYYPVSSGTGWVLRIGAFRYPTCTHLFSDGFETGATGRWSATAP